MNGQAAPKKANLITMKTSDSIDDAYKKIGRLLINAGYEIETANKDFYLITTKVKQQEYGLGNMGSLEMKLTFEFNEVSDSTHITIRGLANSAQLLAVAGGKNQRFDKNAFQVENRGGRGSILKSAWVFMDDLARQYENCNIEYTIEDKMWSIYLSVDRRYFKVVLYWLLRKPNKINESTHLKGMEDVTAYVYIIQSESSGQYYIGYTKDLNARITTHQRDEGGWTSGKGPWWLVYYEVFLDDSNARKREIKLKKSKNKRYITWLIENGPGTSVA